MAEYIEREALLNHVNDLPVWGVDGDMLDRQDVISSIENRPAADVAPVRHGRWIKKKEKDTFAGYLEYYECSECGRLEGKKESYCNCGAKMDLED